MLNILILDDASTPTLASKKKKFHTYVTLKEANLFLITTKGNISKQDQPKYRGFVELDSLCNNGMVELIAKAWHDKFTLHEIYCQNEDLLIRASYLREFFNLSDSGLNPDTVVCKVAFIALTFSKGWWMFSIHSW
ncbi:hypothetical protein HMI55_003200 [Coelomomyces lativittatus]|nr:hypothetical protein HMI55_003200 [Coelomomyces lativittatus]